MSCSTSSTGDIPEKEPFNGETDRPEEDIVTDGSKPSFLNDRKDHSANKETDQEHAGITGERGPECSHVAVRDNLVEDLTRGRQQQAEDDVNQQLAHGDDQSRIMKRCWSSCAGLVSVLFGIVAFRVLQGRNPAVTGFDLARQAARLESKCAEKALGKAALAGICYMSRIGGIADEDCG